MDLAVSTRHKDTASMFQYRDGYLLTSMTLHPTDTESYQRCRVSNRFTNELTINTKSATITQHQAFFHELKSVNGDRALVGMKACPRE